MKAEPQIVQKLQCQHRVKEDLGKDNQGRRIFAHKPCEFPAQEVEIQGMLTTARAILCKYHAKMADKEAWVSDRGWKKGKITKEEGWAGYKQTRFSLEDNGSRSSGPSDRSGESGHTSGSVGSAVASRPSSRLNGPR
jgi:hypothetical protein